MIFYQGLQDCEKRLTVLFALRIPTSRGLQVEVGIADIADIELAQIGCRKLRTVGINVLSNERVNECLVWFRRVVESVRNDHSRVGRHGVLVVVSAGCRVFGTTGVSRSAVQFI